MKWLTIIFLFIGISLQAQWATHGQEIYPDSIVVNGIINMDNYGVYAYLSTPSTTTTTNAGQYYYMTGTFTNEVMYNFAIVSDTLTYQGNITTCFEIILNGSFSSDTPNTEITIGLFKNGAIQANSEMTVEVNQTTDIVQISTCDVLELTNGDRISIWIKSDKAGAKIDNVKFTTSLKLFHL